MAVERVEVDEVGEDQVAVAGVVHRAQRGVEQRHVAGRLAHFGDAAMRVDVADLADADHLAAAPGDAVEQRRLRRRHGIVAAVGGALEVGRRLADEGPGDDAADVQRVDQPANDLAERIEPLEAEMGLVRGDLEDGIGRGVADRLAGADVLLAEAGDDVRARGMAVAEDAGKPRLRG
jgi:hypothetical protein